MGGFRQLSDGWSSTRRTLTVTALLLVFCRGVFVWLVNCFIFLYIAYKFYFINGTKPNRIAPVIDNSKTSQEDLWMTYPGPQEDDLEGKRRSGLSWASSCSTTTSQSP